MRRRAMAGAATVAALLVVGCGSAAIESTPASTTVAPPPSAASLEDLLARLPAQTATSVGPLVEVAQTLDEQCGDPITWLATLETVPAVVAAAERAFRTLPADERRTLVQDFGLDLSTAVADRLIGQSGCRAEGATTSVPSLDRLLAATGRATAAVDSLHLVLHPQFILARSLHFAQEDLAHAEWLLTVGQSPTPWTAVIGSSQARLGIDSLLLGDATDTLVGNVAVDGGHPEGQPPRLAELDRIASPAELIWIVSALDVFGLCDTESRRDQQLDVVTRRDGAFDLVWFPAVDPWERLLGPAANRSYRNELTELAAAEFVPDGMGAVVAHDESDPRLFDVSMSLNEPTFASGSSCDERLDILFDQVAQQAARGRPVTVVAIPTSAHLVDRHPEGANGVAEAVAALAQPVTAAGGRFVDLSGGADAGMFLDATHLNSTGRRVVTTRLAEQLAAG
ncbi:MAG: hypothetical protein OEW42_11810 [Acidimicrobiia bacterium]|nr:hypothetical protein [Acidimicrobiia bacterium]